MTFDRPFLAPTSATGASMAIAFVGGLLQPRPFLVGDGRPDIVSPRGRRKGVWAHVERRDPFTERLGVECAFDHIAGLGGLVVQRPCAKRVDTFAFRNTEIDAASQGFRSSERPSEGMKVPKGVRCSISMFPRSMDRSWKVGMIISISPSTNIALQKRKGGCST